MVNSILFNAHVNSSLNKSLTNLGWVKPDKSTIITSPYGLYIISTSEYRGTVTIALKQVTETLDFKLVSTTRVFRRDGHAIFINAHKTNPNLNTETDIPLDSYITYDNAIKNTDAMSEHFTKKILPQNIKEHKVVSDLTKPFTRSTYIRFITESLLGILHERGYKVLESSPVTNVHFKLEQPLTGKVVNIYHRSLTKINIEVEPNTLVHIHSDKGVISIFNRNKIEKHLIGKSDNLNDLTHISRDIASNALDLVGI